MPRCRTFKIVSLGCKVNQYDGQAIRERFEKLGLTPVERGGNADVVVVNTCTVTARAEAKSRKEIRRMIRRHPRSQVVVTGCGVEVNADRFLEIAGVDRALTKSQMTCFRPDAPTAELGGGDILDLGIASFEGHTRAFLRIQEGCDAFCSYCIVPHARGRSRSRGLSDIAEEAKRLVDRGHREIVLTGIHLGAYGKDLGDADLCDAMRAALDVEGLQRLRLSSIEAMEVSERILDLAAEDTRVCPHFHLPLQSGADEVLRAMNRRYTAREFLEVVERIRHRLSRPAITTDVMVGFPRETEEHFEKTLRLCREARFSRMHVFPFSPRPGVPAAEIQPRVPKEAIAERERRALELARSLALEYKQSFVGQVVKPLVESRRDRETGLLTGLTERYLTVRLEGPDCLMNSIVPVRVANADPDRLRGEWIREEAKSL